MKPNLTKDEYYLAVKDGAKEALLEMTESVDMYRTEQFMEAIRQGVQDAIWQISTNATSMPCADFYHSIQEGVKESMEFKNITQYCKCQEKESDTQE